MATITVNGSPFATIGEIPPPGTQAPDFRLVNPDMVDVSLADFAGKRKIISIILSVGTPVCQASNRRFNERAATLDNTDVLVVSVDTPFALKSYCEAEGIDGVHTLSTLRTRAFAKDYGTLITEGPLAGAMCRALVVLDENDKVIHSELVSEIGDEPDYDAAFASLS